MGRCLSEAIERHSAVYSGTSDIIQSSFLDLGSTAIDPRLLMQFSDAQYVSRMAWNARVEAAHQIPKRFDDKQNIGWVSFHSLTSQSTKFIPAAYCFLGNPNAHDEGFPIPDSSGLAAGGTTNDAVERGLLELIERDAVSIWWYNRLAMPPLTIDLAELSLWEPFADWIKRCKRQFWLLDLTTDLGVPVAAAISCDENDSDLSFGFAAGTTQAAAAENALCEMVQFEVTKKYHKQKMDGPYPHFLSWCRFANINDHGFVVAADAKRKILVHQPLTAEVIVDRLAHKGLEVFAYEFPSISQHTKVVRAIVPGLRPIWPRLAAGRLYDVSYELGRVERRKREEELNPVPILY
jgi:thiazole/oxazole-forming peptide maturase SagD family component